MILINNTAHQLMHQQGAHQWRKRVIGVIALSLVIQAIIGCIALYHYHHVSTLLKPLEAHAQENRERVLILKQWKAAITTFEAGRKQREANQQKVNALYERLADFHAVNLRLLRIKPNYIYCGIEGLSEIAVQQYQAYLKKMHYKPVSQQLIENIWFLEFVRHDNP